VQRPPVRRKTTSTVDIIYGEDGVLRVRVLPDVRQTTDDARDNLAICREMLGARKVPVVIDVRDAYDLDRPTRQVYANETDFATAQALVVKSAFSRIAGSFFLRVVTLRHPARLFDDEDKALDWLREFLR
jgi:hypothetical protein